MIYKIKKKLIHFYTNGSIAEDFVASRRVKVNKLRNIIRACFYLHCAAALLCIGLSIVLGAGITVVHIALCALISAWLALFAVGDPIPVKILLCVADLAFAAAGFTAGALFGPKAPFFVCGAIMTVAGLAGIISLTAALCKDYLLSFSPRLIRREDYTLLSVFGDDIPDLPVPEEEIPPLPPLTSEMRELAKQMREILCAEQENDADLDEDLAENDDLSALDFE